MFLQKRSRLEEEQASGLRKISRATHENLRRPEHRQGSFIASYDEITRIHERMADNGSQFAQSLHQMHDDLSELAANIERGRKQWKQTGLAAEQRLVDAETVMRKAKAKYDALAEDYDRARTGDRQTTKKFGLKGPKSAAQHEEELLRKVQAADADYAAKVQAAQATKQEHLQRGRPEAVKNLQDMIKECDSALTMQMQNFASFNEKLLVSNGMSVSPLKGEPAASDKNGRSLRDAIADINNDGDLSYYVASHSSQVVPKPEIRYERNPVSTAPLPNMITDLLTHNRFLLLQLQWSFLISREKVNHHKVWAASPLAKAQQEAHLDQHHQTTRQWDQDQVSAPGHHQQCSNSHNSSTSAASANLLTNRHHNPTAARTWVATAHQAAYLSLKRLTAQAAHHNSRPCHFRTPHLYHNPSTVHRL